MAKLVLLRHGQSLFNEQGRFTGWMDIDLSESGKAEAAQAGWLMRCHGLSFDIANLCGNLEMFIKILP